MEIAYCKNILNNSIPPGNHQAASRQIGQNWIEANWNREPLASSFELIFSLCLRNVLLEDSSSVWAPRLWIWGNNCYSRPLNDLKTHLSFEADYSWGQCFDPWTLSDEEYVLQAIWWTAVHDMQPYDGPRSMISFIKIYQERDQLEQGQRLKLCSCWKNMV